MTRLHIHVFAAKPLIKAIFPQVLCRFQCTPL